MNGASLRRIARRSLLLISATLLTTAPMAYAEHQQIIDVHRHAAWPHTSDRNNFRANVIKAMDRNNISVAVLSISSTDQIERWVKRYPGRFIAGPMLPCPENSGHPRFHCFESNRGLPELDWLERQIKAGHVGVLHEMMFNYDGSAPADEKVQPYWALAAEYDIPVGVHTESGPPPGGGLRSDPKCCPNYNGDMGNPELLRPVLQTYPGLRIWLQHVGSDGPGSGFWDETLALLADYQNVYLDLTITNSVLPADQHEEALRQLINAGFGDRIMFGTDNIPADTILKRYEAIEWLTPTQRAAILHGNAERFFRLPPQ
ncbi:MAG: hypothetical protein DHS20C11_20830 [Lysobacteraceae bacterium]|nr:MAG: hypothetical protein DHS20C11_20830 [Xanthomonadaceae bacterium]